MKNKLNKSLLIVLLAFQTTSCNKAPEKEMIAVKEALNLAIKEKLNISNPIDFYFLQDSVYKVLEEIEKEKSKLFSTKFDKHATQLKDLIIKIEHLRKIKNEHEKMLIEDSNIKVDSL